MQYAQQGGAAAAMYGGYDEPPHQQQQRGTPPPQAAQTYGGGGTYGASGSHFTGSEGRGSNNNYARAGSQARTHACTDDRMIITS